MKDHEPFKGLPLREETDAVLCLSQYKAIAPGYLREKLAEFSSLALAMALFRPGLTDKYRRFLQNALFSRLEVGDPATRGGVPPSPFQRVRRFNRNRTACKIDPSADWTYASSINWRQTVVAVVAKRLEEKEREG